MDLIQWLGPSALIGLIGAVIKFSSDYSKLKTLTDGQEKDIKRLEKLIENNQSANKEQHETFYANQRDTLELKRDMKHILDSLDKMMMMMERRKEER